MKLDQAIMELWDLQKGLFSQKVLVFLDLDVFVGFSTRSLLADEGFFLK